MSFNPNQPEIIEEIEKLKAKGDKMGVRPFVQVIWGEKNGYEIGLNIPYTNEYVKIKATKENFNKLHRLMELKKEFKDNFIKILDLGEIE